MSCRGSDDEKAAENSRAAARRGHRVASLATPAVTPRPWPAPRPRCRVPARAVGVLVGVRQVAGEGEHVAGSESVTFAGDHQVDAAVEAGEVLARAGQVRRAGHRRAGREVEHFHHLVGNRLGNEIADRHAAALDAKGDVGRPANGAPWRAARRAARRSARRAHARPSRAPRATDCRHPIRGWRSVERGTAAARASASWVRLRVWRRPARLRARCVAAERSSSARRRRSSRRRLDRVRFVHR